MKIYLRLIAVIIFAGFCLGSPVTAATVQVETFHSQDRYQAGGSYPVILKLNISEGWYIHSFADEGGYLIPTSLKVDGVSGIKFQDLRFPSPENRKFDYAPDPINVYSGRILIKAVIEIDTDVSPGEHVIRGFLSYQACSLTACRPPENIPVDIPLQVVQPGTSVTVLNRDIFKSAEQQENQRSDQAEDIFNAGLLLSLFGIFLGGMALNLTPCIYPLIPITVSYFSGKSEKVKSHVIMHGLFYILGLSITNSILGVSASLSGNLLGSALQNPILLVIVACIMIFMGLSFFGVWEIRLPGILARATRRNYSGYFGTFFMGLTLGVVAAPCLGPFILGLLTYVGQRGDPVLGFLYFFILSIGMGLPLTVLAIFSGAIDRLPRSGDWMIWVKKVMGWVLLGMAMYMISPLIHSYTAKTILTAAIFIVAGIHLGWIDKTGKTVKPFLYVKVIIGILAVLSGLIYFVSSNLSREEISWVEYDEAVIAGAAKDGVPLILDFYADWCTPCREMDKQVLSDPEIVRLSQNLIAMRLDLTQRHENQDELLKQYKVRGVPTVIFINRDGIEEEGLRIEALVSRAEFLDRMKRLLKK